MPRTYRQRIDPDEARRRDLATIHILKKQAMEAHPGFTDENYRDIIWEIGKIGSSADLDDDGRLALIRRLDELAPKSGQTPQKKGAADARTWHARNSYRKHARGNDKIITLATPEEIDKINRLAKLITWRVENGLTLFLEKRMGLKDGKVRTSVNAMKAIEGLKMMYRNGMKKEHGADWWVQRFDDPEVMRFIAEHAPAEFR